MGRSKVTGPAIGGMLIVPLMNKSAGSAGVVQRDQFIIPFPWRFNAITGFRVGAAGTNMTFRVSGATWGISVHTPATYILNNEANVFGSGAQAGTWTTGQGDAGNVDKFDVPIRTNDTRTATVDMNIAGASVVAFGYCFQHIITPRGYIYDNDNPASPFNDDFYYASKD